MICLSLKVIHYHGQILAMNECGYRQTYQSKYLLIQDIDEFVVPTVADDWASMIRDIASSKSADMADHIASYNFRNRFYWPRLAVVTDPVSVILVVLLLLIEYRLIALPLLF